MQQFVVPQFIDVEDKIFGPITTRQFLILLITGIIIFLAYKYADFALFITLASVLGGLALLFSFVRVNGQTFHFFILNVGQTLRRPKLRIWHKYYNKKELDYFRKQETAKVELREAVDKRSIHHIRDLSLIVNTGGFYHPDEDFL